MRIKRVFSHAVRDVEIGELQDIFLVSAVTMILVIRLQLWLTNYPQLGSGKLHIAHLLWGGLLMLVALILLLSYLGRAIRTPAAVIGGIGFGFFIDELGKFITSDNDYFYKPSTAIIYLVFIAIYLITRGVTRRRGFSPREYLVNAVDTLMEAARHDLDERERERAIALIDKADPDDPLVEPVRRLLHDVEAVPTPEPNRVTRLAFALRDRYFDIVEKPWFARAVGWVFTVWAVISLLTIIALGLSLGLSVTGAESPLDFGGGRGEDVSFINIAGACSSVLAGLLVIVGVWELRRKDDRLAAYRMFERAILVQIFIGQVFSFVESQFSAIFTLGIDILLLITIRFMIRKERELERRKEAGGYAASRSGDAAEAPATAAGRAAAASP
jgi:hypothetical protein